MPPSLEELRERARTWTEPISEEAPAGRPARHEPAYDLVAQEVARLESPTGTPVSWSKVVTNAGELLQRRTKDLWLTSYLAHGLHATEGLRGAVTGVTVLTEVLDRYWPTLFPEVQRLRGRVNAVGWFVARMTESLPSVQITGEDWELVEGLETATRRLAEVSRIRFEEQGPSLKPLLEGVERLRNRLPASAAPRPPTPPAPAAEPPASPATPPAPPAPVAPPAPAAPPAVLAPSLVLPGEKPGSADNVLDALRGIGASLAESARLLREANTADPLAYRLLRVGLWLHFTQPPAPGPEGKTPVPALPASLREKLERLETHARWAELLEEAESLLGQHRFVLDLQRYVTTALAGLGPTHAAAREAARLELRALLQRMPAVLDLLASDGTPLADERTRKWVEAEVMERSAPSAPLPRTDERPEDGADALPPEVRELLAADRVAEALARLQQQVTTATTGRARFKARLLLGRLCVLSGQHLMAQALYETLVAESTTRGMDEWEPQLSAECLEGLLLVTRTVQKTTPSLPRECWPHFIRLSKLDPAAAFRLGQ
ncbi:type VI secretion system protein TssA [Cystobacter ferrugineus]|uniref:Type VI secretion system ImpA domain-containing protein n=1 Tax=Cystobacter ferrugineus TaxID=83449 RepID=A0A1L9B7B9_9BACT|nr:type VI secretion system protein TssA [Cystobacter ferrugineus]OJH38145.1 type VI secretion system ImpA domain-containing protein [Cystobacter ferrugineus]